MLKILKYFLTYIFSFTFTSFIDYLWHLVIWKQIYFEGIKKVSQLKNNQIALKPFPGLLSQVLVVLSIMFLTLYKKPNNYLDSALIGSFAGILAITVYGLVNFALIKNWDLKITLLEIIWGPIIGSLSSLFIFWLASLFKL